MSAALYDGGTGGKIRKRLLRREPSTPYERPALAARGLLASSASEGGGSGWLSRLVDPASRAIARSASRLLSSVLRKRLVAPLLSSGENLNSIGELQQVNPSAEVGTHNENVVDERNDGTDGIFKLEKLIKQKNFTRAETEHLKEIVHSISLEPSDLQSAGMKNKEMVNEQSHVNPRSSQVLNQAVNQEEDKKENASELLDKGEQEIRSQGNYSCQVQEEDAPSPIEIAKAYMGSRPLNVVPSTSGFLRKSLNEDKHISLNIPVGDVQSSVAIASNFSEIPSGSHDGYMTPKLQGSSAIYNTSRLPYFRSHMMTDIRRGSRPRKPSEWTPTSVFMHSVHRQAQKRGSLVLDNDGESGHSRRVRPKSCSTSLPLSSRTASLSTTSCGPYNEQETTSFYVVEKSDNRKYLACVGYVPPKSTEMARKILLQLDKLVPSPKAKSSDKKVIIGDTSSSKSYLNTSHAGNSIIPRMINSEPPFLDKAKGEVLPSSPYVESKATSSGIGFTHLPAQKESTLQNTSTKNVTFSSETETTEKSMIHTCENLQIPRMANSMSSTKEASNKTYAEKYGRFTRPAMPISCSLSKPPQSPIVAASSADELTPKIQRNALPVFKFGSKVLTADAPKTLNAGKDASFPTTETMVNHPTTELGKTAFFASTGAPASSSSRSTLSATPMFKFGPNNAAAYSFSDLSSLFPSATASLPSTSFASIAAPACSSSPSTSSASPTVPSVTFQFGNGNSAGYCFSGLSNLFSHATSGVSSSSSSDYSQRTIGQVGLLNSQQIVEDNMVDEALRVAPTARPISESTTLSSTPSFMFSSSATPSGAQTFQLGANQNSSATASGNGGLLPGGSFSLGSGGVEKSERKFIRVRRDKLKRKVG